MKKPFFFRRPGQSLAEILVAVSVGTLLIVGAVTVIAPALRSNTQAAYAQVGTALAKELLDNVQVFSQSDWHNIDSLSTSSLSKYYLNTSSSPFTSVLGIQSLVVSNATYNRNFYVQEVQRDSIGNIVTSGGTVDPSTRQVIVEYSWPQSATKTVSTYITRSRNMVFIQSDWSSGPGQEGPVTSTGAMFASSSNIDYSTSTGSIMFRLP